VEQQHQDHGPEPEVQFPKPEHILAVIHFHVADQRKAEKLRDDLRDAVVGA
jgi:hypothetical protein